MGGAWMADSGCFLGDIGIFDEYCRLIEYNNDNSQDYVQIHYENNGSPDTLGIETPAGLYPRTGGYLQQSGKKCRLGR